jgi:hypothetical protein
MLTRWGESVGLKESVVVQIDRADVTVRELEGGGFAPLKCINGVRG